MLVGVGFNFDIPKNLSKSVIIVAHAPQKNLIKIYQAASCLITTSLYESFNLPVLEALSQKTQVVGLKEALIPELEPYCWVEPSNLQKFAKTIIKAINKPKFINLPKLKKQFSWQKYLKQLTKLYE